jgi:hypothetical protein
LIPIESRRRLWALWAIFAAALALLVAIPHLVPSRPHPWYAAQIAVAGLVLALLSLPAAVSTFALRERLGEDRAAAPGPPAAAQPLLLALWARCVLIGVFGCVLSLGAASPAAGWPFAAAAAALLVLHAPRRRLFARPLG